MEGQRSARVAVRQNGACFSPHDCGKVIIFGLNWMIGGIRFQCGSVKVSAVYVFFIVFVPIIPSHSYSLISEMFWTETF